MKVRKKRLSGQFCHYCTPHLLGKRSPVENFEEYSPEADLERLSEVPGDQMISRVFYLITRFLSQPIRAY